MEILTTKKASELWGISARRITALCEQGRIHGAIKESGIWILPANSKKPADARVKNGNYINWRNKTELSCNDFQSNLKNLKGTFAVEGMRISEESMANLELLASGKMTCLEIVEKIKQKYMQRI